MDALWKVLGAVRITGGVFLDARFTAHWCVFAKSAPRTSPVPGRSVQMIAYHYVSRAACWSGRGRRPLEVRAGEAVLFPRNDPHVVGSASRAAGARRRTHAAR